MHVQTGGSDATPRRAARPASVDETAALRLAFYADDFTGATDTLATVARAGLRAMLFLRPPTPEQRAAAGTLDCLGIAGAARAMRNDMHREELEAIGAYLASLPAPVFHYKTCSTFDSSPDIGSIGLAVRVLRQRLRAGRFLPVVGGQPNLGRYCVFGNLFAAYRTGGEVFRLDRHPSMSRHPVTPSDEADLRRHLCAQGLTRMSAIPYTAYALPADRLDKEVACATEAGPDGVLFDVGMDEHLREVGRVIWQHAQHELVLAVGPSSVEQALLAHWAQARQDVESPAGPVSHAHYVAPGNAARDGPVLVLSGSLSPRTAQQVAAAASYRHMPVSMSVLLGDNEHDRRAVQAAIIRTLQSGRHVLAVLADPGDRQDDARLDPATVAEAGGRLLASILQGVRPARLGLAGGDTSSHCIQALDVWGLSYRTQIEPGVALCRLHADASHLDGLEVMLKGGQMGSDGIFEKLLGAAA